MLLFHWRRKLSLVISLVLLVSLMVPIGSMQVSADVGGSRTHSGVDIAAGAAHSLLLKSDGTVVAWGDNSRGQSTVPAGLKDVIAIAAGDQHSLALKSDGTIVGWGNNDDNQINIPTELAAGGVAAIAAGRAHSAAIKANGEVVVWGDNAYSLQSLPSFLSARAISANANFILAINSIGFVVAWGQHTDTALAVPAGIEDVIAVQAGDQHGLLLTSYGVVQAWGDNSKGQLDVPADVVTEGALRIAAGGDYSLALMPDGTIAGWGENGSVGADIPAGLSGVIAIAAGEDHALALKSDGTVVAWGDNTAGQLNVPAGLTMSSRVIQVAAGYNHALALRSDGTLVGWGNNAFDQSSIPVELASGGVKAIDAGYQYSMALKDNGHLVVWGNPANNITTLPPELENGGIIAIAAGPSHALALLADGKLVAWGRNDSGQTDLPTSYPINALVGGVVAIEAGLEHSVALNARGQVRAWGKSDDNQTSVPTIISSGGAMAIGTGNNHSFALESYGSGSVHSWGNDYWDQRSIPSELSLRNITSVVGGHCYSAALLDDGTVHAWGCPDEGQTAVPSGLSGIAALYGAQDYTLALKSDGTVVGWGVNVGGVLNIPTLLQDSTPPTVTFETNGNPVVSTSAATKVTVSDTQSGVNSTSLQYAWTNSAALPGSGWAAFINEETLSLTSGSGQMYLHIQARDQAGNWVHAVSNPFVFTAPSPSPSIPDPPTVSLSGNADLASLKVLEGTKELVLSPVFAPGTVEYTTTTTADQVVLELVAAHSKAVIKHAGEAITTPVKLDLETGNIGYAIEVYAENGALKKYTLNIIKETVSKRACLFTDITNHWAQANICEAVELGLVSGVSELIFDPNRDVTRTEFTVMLVRMLGLTSSDEAVQEPFSDHAQIPQWAQAEMNIAISAGLIDGYPSGELLPLQAVTRAEMARLIVNAMQWELEANEELNFQDTQLIPAWARSYVNTAYQHGVIKGRSGNSFAPGEHTTRAEAASILLRMWKLQHQ